LKAIGPDRIQFESSLRDRWFVTRHPPRVTAQRWPIAPQPYVRKVAAGLEVSSRIGKFAKAFERKTKILYRSN